MPFCRSLVLAATVVLASHLFASDAFAVQSMAPGLSAPTSSRNVSLISHIPLGGIRSVDGSTTGGFADLGRRTGDVAVEQDAGRPFVYVARRQSPSGIVALDLSDESDPSVLAEWTLSQDHDGPGIPDIKLFRVEDKWYAALAIQVGPRDVYENLAVIILDISDVANGKISETTRINADGGYGRIFAYRHSDGRSFLFGAGGKSLDTYDLDNVLAGDHEPLNRLFIPIDVPNVEFGFNDMHAAFHLESETDRLYTSGAGGFYIYNVTDPAMPSLLASVSSAAVQIGDVIVPTPDGTTIVTTAGYRASPLRIYDIQPALDGSVSNIRTATGAWVADWRNRTASISVRWPFIFTASMEDGFQAVNMMNPLELFTAGYYKTWTGQSSGVSDPETDRTGAIDIDVRNHDGLILVTDSNTGLWIFRMDGFQGWDGRGWGLPDISSVQNWVDGPVNAAQWPIDGGSD